jgi:hypothetical protein
MRFPARSATILAIAVTGFRLALYAEPPPRFTGSFHRRETMPNGELRFSWNTSAQLIP